MMIVLWCCWGCVYLYCYKRYAAMVVMLGAGWGVEGGGYQEAVVVGVVVVVSHVQEEPSPCRGYWGRTDPLPPDSP